MNLKYQIIHKKNLQDSHREIFSQLLEEQGKVKGDLTKKADRCRIICIVSQNSTPIAIGGIKKKTPSDFSKEKANIPDIEKYFNWELGYIYTKDDFTRKGIASTIVNLLIAEYGDENLMASTEISANQGMVKILEKSGFRHYGTPWRSGIHTNYLGLFLKYKQHIN